MKLIPATIRIIFLIKTHPVTKYRQGAYNTEDLKGQGTWGLEIKTLRKLSPLTLTSADPFWPNIKEKRADLNWVGLKA